MENKFSPEAKITLIDLVHANPELWNVNNRFYYCNPKKQEIWSSIVGQLKECHPDEFDEDPDVTEVQKMWRNLRDGFQKKKTAISKAITGSGTSDVQVNWPYWESLQFLNESSKKVCRKSNLGPVVGHEVDESAQNGTAEQEEIVIFDEVTDEKDKENKLETPKVVRGSLEAPPSKRKKVNMALDFSNSKKNDNVSKLLDVMSKDHQQADEYEDFGNFIGRTVRNIARDDKDEADDLMAEMHGAIHNAKKRIRTKKQ